MLQQLYLNGYLYTITHGSTIHNCQQVGATRVSIGGRTDKHNVVHPCNTIVSVLTKEGHRVTYPLKALHQVKARAQKGKYCRVPLM